MGTRPSTLRQTYTAVLHILPHIVVDKAIYDCPRQILDTAESEMFKNWACELRAHAQFIVEMCAISNGNQVTQFRNARGNGQSGVNARPKIDRTLHNQSTS